MARTAGSNRTATVPSRKGLGGRAASGRPHRTEGAANAAPTARQQLDGAKLRLIGLAGAGGCAAALVADIVGILVHPHFNARRRTISDLAAGENAWISDLGLYALAIGLAFIAWGLWRLTDEARRRGIAWRGGAVALGLAAVCIAVIAGYSEYGDGDTGGITIHMEVVYTLAALFFLAPLLLAKGLTPFGHVWRNASFAFAGLWLVLAPPFLIMPTAWDGLYERLLALLLIAWVGGLSVLLVREGRRRTREAP